VTNRTWINNSQEARRERRCMPHVTGVGESRPGNYTPPVPSGVDHMDRVTTQQAVWNALTFPRLCRTLAAASHALRKTRAIARRSNAVGRSVSILVTFVSHAKKTAASIERPFRVGQSHPVWNPQPEHRQQLGPNSKMQFVKKKDNLWSMNVGLDILTTTRGFAPPNIQSGY